METEKGKYSRMGYVLILGVVLIIAAPIIAMHVLEPTYFNGTGQIGDTIGGMTAPISSLLGSILVYFALRAQIDANNIVLGQLHRQREEEESKKVFAFIAEQIDVLRKDLNEFTITYTKTSGNWKDQQERFHSYNGSGAVTECLLIVKMLREDCNSWKLTGYAKYHELRAIVEYACSVYNQAEEAAIDARSKKYFRSLISYSFKTKLKPSFDFHRNDRERDSGNCPKCGGSHIGIPEELFRIVDELDDKLNK